MIEYLIEAYNNEPIKEVTKPQIKPIEKPKPIVKPVAPPVIKEVPKKFNLAEEMERLRNPNKGQ